MSFSSDVKNELARLDGGQSCCEKAELLGVLRMSGAIIIRGLKMGIHFTTENAALARRVLQMLKSHYEVKTQVVMSRSTRLKKTNRYRVEVLPSPIVYDALKELQILPSEEGNREDILGSDCCRRAFLRGAFMAGGSISRPISDYHMEMVTENGQFAKLIMDVMNEFHLDARMTDRKNDYIVYLKDSDKITDFLSIIGAHQALLEFENVRIVKEMRNNVNRVVNCETANLNKVIRASVLQIASINYLKENDFFEDLPANLKETAEMRLENPDASLKELADLTGGKPGKSGINHRLKKLEQIAEEKGMRINVNY